MVQNLENIKEHITLSMEIMVAGGVRRDPRQVYRPCFKLNEKPNKTHTGGKCLGRVLVKLNKSKYPMQETCLPPLDSESLSTPNWCDAVWEAIKWLTRTHKYNQKTFNHKLQNEYLDW